MILFVSMALLVLTPGAQAHAAPLHTLRFRVPVPAARDVSILSFELRIGAEGKHHRKQPVILDLINHREPGVFGLARLRPEPGHPGRFLGVVEVFHRASAGTSALPSGLAALAQTSPLASAHAAMGSFDEFIVRARNEHVVKEVIKTNIVLLAALHGLGPDEFCDPHSFTTYLLGNAVIHAAYVLAGTVTGLPTDTSISDLADDAVYELCTELEEEMGDDPYVDEEHSGINILGDFLGVDIHVGAQTTPSSPSSSAPSPPSPPTSTYHLEFSGAWAFEGANEVKLTGMLTGMIDLSDPPPPALTNPASAIEVVLPLAGSMPRVVTNYICPSQLPTAAIVTTNNTNDTLMCSGGQLPLNQQFFLNVQSSPLPSAGMGGELIVQQNGAYLAPLTFVGP